MAFERITTRSGLTGPTCDRLESEALHFHHRVRDGYLAIAQAEPDRVVVLNAADSVSTLKSENVQRVDRHFALATTQRPSAPASTPSAGDSPDAILAQALALADVPGVEQLAATSSLPREL